MEYVPLSLGCIPREQSCLGTQTLWGTRVLNIYYITCNLHTIKAFFPSCPSFHLFFLPLINLLGYKQEKEELKASSDALSTIDREQTVVSNTAGG